MERPPFGEKPNVSNNLTSASTLKPKETFDGSDSYAAISTNGTDLSNHFNTRICGYLEDSLTTGISKSSILQDLRIITMPNLKILEIEFSSGSKHPTAYKDETLGWKIEYRFIVNEDWSHDLAAADFDIQDPDNYLTYRFSDKLNKFEIRWLCSHAE